MSPDQTPAKVSPSVPKEGQDRKFKPPPPDHHSKCPRCDSPNTKFCYYNNYSLSQPRHFCKTCRRYWTKGGALRNIPIGGGCRKNKKMKQRLTQISNSRDSSCEIMGSSSGEGLNFFQGFLFPTMDFQLGSINPPPSTTSSMFPISGTDANFTLYDQHHHETSHPNPSHHPIISGAVPTLPGFSYLRSSQSSGVGEQGTLQMGISSNNSMIVHSNLASSIESLSSINQELHWKLQQQRLAVLFSGGGDLSEKLSTQSDMTHVGDHQFIDHHDQQQLQSQTHKLQLQPILFQNLEAGKEADRFPTGESITEDPEGSGKSRLGGNNAGSATEWFFDVHPYARGRDNNNNNDMLNNDEDNDHNQIHNWNTGGIQLAWSNMQQQYDGALP